LPQRLDALFVMRKGDRLAVCALHTHDLGWECRLFSGEEMIATQVCRTDKERGSKRSARFWRAALTLKEWS